MTPVAPAAAVRLLRIETKRSAVPWVLPLLAVLFLIDPFRTASGYPEVWTVRASVVPNKMLPDFVAFAGGFAAWAGSREGRRHTADLLAATARPAWARRAAAFAATVTLFVVPFLAGVVVLYVRTAQVATWGGPPLWPVVVSVVTLFTVCAVGFCAGAWFPGRFTAPLVTIGVFVAYLAGFRNAVGESSSFALLAPSTVVPRSDAGVFYHVAPDVAIAQVMFMGGITVALLGALAFSRPLRPVAIAVLAAGAALAVTGFGLAGTARQGLYGPDIPALHDAASDQPVPYTPECSGKAFAVCVHPAFGRYLDDLASALEPVAAEVAGLPGAPVRAAEADSATQSGHGGNGVISGAPPVYEFNMNSGLGVLYPSDADLRQGFQQDFLNAFAGTPLTGPGTAPGPAQQAVVTALMGAVGSAPHYPQVDNGTPPKGMATPAQIDAAAVRFASLSPAARHAWLAANLPALRAGHITLAQLP